jgi:hypothetical protein
LAIAARDASKRRVYRQVSSALPFVPMSVESFGRLGIAALTLLGDLADKAVQSLHRLVGCKLMSAPIELRINQFLLINPLI